MSLPGKSITRMEAYPKMDSASSLKRQKRPSRLTVKSHSTRLWIFRFSKRRSENWELNKRKVRDEKTFLWADVSEVLARADKVNQVMKRREATGESDEE